MFVDRHYIPLSLRQERHGPFWYLFVPLQFVS